MKSTAEIKQLDEYEWSDYAPKGSMCAACKKSRLNCSSLDFSKMRVAEHCKLSHVSFVICNEFVKGGGDE